MKPVIRKDHNDQFVGERREGDAIVLEGVGNLSVRKQKGDHGPEVVSHWLPSEEELAVLNDGGHVEVTLVTPRIPPLAVNVEPAEQPDPKPGPPTPSGGGDRPVRHA